MLWKRVSAVLALALVATSLPFWAVHGMVVSADDSGHHDGKRIHPRSCSCRTGHQSSSSSTKSSLTTFPSSSPTSQGNNSVSSIGGGSNTRLEKINSLYGFTGFVYALDSCPSPQNLRDAFSGMSQAEARVVITFGLCGDGTDPSFWTSVINAAGNANVYIIPLVHTLGANSYTVNAREDAIIKAVQANPGYVLAVALGDEPLFDNDFGSSQNLANSIKDLRSKFSSVKLDIPISISDMAYAYTSNTDSNLVAEAVDFFMINTFPYFAQGAVDGTKGSGAWDSFTKDIDTFNKIRQGKPWLVTQTGWPSEKKEFLPNSAKIAVTVQSEENYWNLLDSECGSYFKPMKLGWMWRSWDDGIVGWGVLDANGKPKWAFKAQTC